MPRGWRTLSCSAYVLYVSECATLLVDGYKYRSYCPHRRRPVPKADMGPGLRRPNQIVKVGKRSTQ
jgi:hypothetical protein